jgi:hypothetical protein
MDKVTAKNVIYYKCPECDSKNTIDVFSIGEAFECTTCSKPWTYIGLCKAYGSTDPDIDLLNANSIEFECKCGTINIIHSRKTRTVETDEGEYNKREDYYESPLFGLCEECLNGYELEYELPPVMKKLLEHMIELGYPHDDEEKKIKWIDNNRDMLNDYLQKNCIIIDDASDLRDFL